MRIERVTVGPLQENTYLLADPEGRGVIIDPGAEPERILEAVRAGRFQPEAILLTHAHFDHVGAVAPLVEALDLPVYLHEADLPLYQNAPAIAAQWGIALPPPPPPTGFLQEGQVLEHGPRLEVLYLPGHSPGHVAFYQPEAGLVFSGDVLFRGSIGRYDLPGASYEALMRSLAELLTLPPPTRVYPGHGPETTLLHEAQTNPFLLEQGR
ncbi:MBL fold metallo-hydrolase [Marinithermus hydrothermalis]|uniref:Beta-lactamase domain protein n=1 Tax=Marinithermus hydrothermalis (strain DSM 14884 / JCM 11576 / T1) TaxID=869210 RepID=F2NKN0_MARHT|nr:MBL fold metallo-hydrolase [Marinithermus hydrothermalis]AEB10793.1 beta-lactamase domain protein [Marinithermus hydrothermalis DSM 14884]